MLSAFPDLLNYSLFSPLVLRIALAFFIATFGIARLKKQSDVSELSWLPLPLRKFASYGTLEVIIAIFLILGLFTQVAALISLFVFAMEWRVKKDVVGIWNLERGAFLLAGAVALSLLFVGAGFFAFDLPL